MKRLLHIIATPRGADSHTLKVSEAFLTEARKKFPGAYIDELNVMTEALPPLTAKAVSGKYVLLSGKELGEELKEAWEPVIGHIERFLSADAYLISVPMWNFHIPYPLKQYIDIIVQPKYMFRYGEKGIEGLVKNKKMAVITSRGGDYSPATPMQAYDFQEPYLRAVFGFVGISDIKFINLQPADMGPELFALKLKDAKEAAINIARGL